MESLTSSPVIIVLTQRGLRTALAIAERLPAVEIHGLARRVSGVSHSFDDCIAHLQALFRSGRPMIGICASGILIRALAPLLSDKTLEPPVLAVAEEGSAVVPLLGGHRGANALARQIAEQFSIQAAVTTSGERRFGIALDAPPAGWTLANPEHYKAFIAKLLADVKLKLNGQAEWLTQSELPFAETAELEICITHQKITGSEQKLIYHPQTLAVGVGCERDVDSAEVIELVRNTLDENQLATESVAAIFSIDLKADETALHELAAELERPLRFFDAKTLEKQTPRLANPSDIVYREVGCHGVAEGAALAAVGTDGELIVAKTKSRRATCAIALASQIIDVNEHGRARGNLAIIGIGPGEPGWRTPQAERLLQQASDLVGYRLYLDLLGDLAEGKTRHDYALGEEQLRVKAALDLAATGQSVALVCSGDPGIYAMAALVFELLECESNPAWQRIEIQVAPGISALQAAAARSGAPLGHDFCTISLSDLLTPWTVIEQRIQAAAAGDFVIAFYNPVSRRRTTQLQRAIEILQQHRPAQTPVVLARNLGRPGEQIRIMTLEELNPGEVDMLTVVLVGSSETRRVGKHWVYTPRGYAAKQNINQEKTA